MRVVGINALVHVLLTALAANYTLRPGLRKWLKGKNGWIDFSVVVRSRDNRVRQTIIFRKGRVRVRWGIWGEPDCGLVFRTPRHVLEMLQASPSQVLVMLVQNRMNTQGNLAYANLFNFLLSLVLDQRQRASDNRN